MTWYEKWAIMVIATAIGVACYYCVPWCKMDVTIWAYWVGAIGTTGTLIGTIWLAMNESRRRRNDASTIARLTAASMYFQHLHNEENASFALKCLEDANNSNLMESGETSLFLVYMNGAIQSLGKIATWSPNELLQLTGLPNDCAAQLAAAQGRISSTLILVGKINIYTDSSAFILNQLSTNCIVLKDAVQQLKQTTRIFQAVIDNS